ncbi:prophage regulatory protein [uncultured Thiomicrorhabdus sp.]
MPQLLKLKNVIEITGISRSHIYALAQEGRFPKPVKLTARSSAWVASEVEEWIESRIQARDMEVA